jgi:hypothetical protein
MNHDHDLPPFDDPAREREWQAQERAFAAERLGLDPAADDARVRRYRLLARTLRQPMPVALPADFAQRTAAQAAAASSRRRTAGAHVESVLTAVLIVTLAVAAGVVVANYGDTWLPAFRHLLPTGSAPATGWLLTLGGCLGASWLLGLWHGHHGPTPG